MTRSPWLTQPDAGRALQSAADRRRIETVSSPSSDISQASACASGSLHAELQAQLERGLRWPKFSPPLEARFEADTGPARTRYLQARGLVGILAYGSFVFTDRLMLPDVQSLAYLVRLGIALPLMALLVASMSWKVSAAWREATLAIGALLTPASIALLVLSSSSPDRMHYHTSGMTLTLLYYVIVMRIRFPQALIACAGSILTGCLTVLTLSELPMQLRMSHTLVFVCTQLFVVMGSHHLDADQRTNYLTGLKERLARDELDAANARLAMLSGMDALTGIANRRQLDAHVAIAWPRAAAAAGPIGVLFIDVDFFKAYNDRYGHAQGDCCLQRIAAALSALMRTDRGELVARYGGEEFVAILPGADRDDTASIAERMRAAVAHLRIAHALSPHDAIITLSIGCAVGEPARGDAFEAVLESADRAVYAVKRAGRNRVQRATEPAESQQA